MDSGDLLQARGLSKAFGGVRALREVSLTVRAGQVHALVGENGAGKSTLVRILAGLHEPDGGELWLKGGRVHLPNPHTARRLGVAMIPQELMPFPELTVAENIMMGQEPASRWLGWIDWPRLRREAAACLDRLGVALDLESPMKALTVAQMQVVEIAKALAHRAELLIMDEPTSALADHEIQALFTVVRDLQRQGVAILYISHKLEEVFRLADTITVLRDGRHVATRPASGLNRDQLIALMVGRELAPGLAPPTPPAPEVLLAVRGLGKAGAFDQVSFEVRRGEVVGLAGLMGAGRTALLRALFGLAPADRGEIAVRGQRVALRHPRMAMARGLAYVGEDRHRSGLVLPLSVKHNLTLATLARYGRGGWVDDAAETRAADGQIQRLGIKTAHRNQCVRHLSGGNQQKVVVGKALLTDPEVLLLDEPTRGIDIGAKNELYAFITQWAHAGKAVLLVSSELPELLALSHRILVMRAGRLAAELDPRRTNEAEILCHATP